MARDLRARDGELRGGSHEDHLDSRFAWCFAVGKELRSRHAAWHSSCSNFRDKFRGRKTKKIKKERKEKKKLLIDVHQAFHMVIGFHHVIVNHCRKSKLDGFSPSRASSNAGVDPKQSGPLSSSLA